ERPYKRDREARTGLMPAAFAVKMLFFGTYVAVMLRIVGLQPLPFVVSFTGYFIALYLTEALLMRRLFAGGYNDARPGSTAARCGRRRSRPRRRREIRRRRGDHPSRG